MTVSFRMLQATSPTLLLWTWSSSSCSSPASATVVLKLGVVQFFFDWPVTALAACVVTALCLNFLMASSAALDTSFLPSSLKCLCQCQIVCQLESFFQFLAAFAHLFLNIPVLAMRDVSPERVFDFIRCAVVLFMWNILPERCCLKEKKKNFVVFRLVSRITRRQTEVCFEPSYNPLLLTGLKAPLTKLLNYFVSRSQVSETWIANCGVFFYIPIQCNLNVECLLHVLKRLFIIWFTCLWCVFKGDNIFLVGQASASVENVNIVILSDTINVTNIELCIMVLHIELCLFISLSVIRPQIPLHLLGPVLLGCCPLQLTSLSSMIVLQPPLLCEGWGGQTQQQFTTMCTYNCIVLNLWRVTVQIQTVLCSDINITDVIQQDVLTFGEWTFSLLCRHRLHCCHTTKRTNLWHVDIQIQTVFCADIGFTGVMQQAILTFGVRTFRHRPSSVPT